MGKFMYKTKRYNSKLELMSENNLTPERFKSLEAMGRIQKTTEDDMVDFAGVHIEQKNKYKYKGIEYRDMAHVCNSLGFSRRKYSALRKSGQIKSINNQNVETDEHKKV
ncbi:hypothetical protein [Flagellimonas sp. CMM7]|uniref:hypothetical protein n=1 Tax=Flagellimonas sp. CMM7 TaxID=2654676 RepID=UPI0013D83CA0|nr:hypothetical protein [Flagellimonas sp. CMM7]UII81505.1 hypothetical protein LV704_08290 [Flagellimonas sp. CMM7]